MFTRRRLFILSVILLVVLILGGGVWLLVDDDKPKPSKRPTGTLSLALSRSDAITGIPFARLTLPDGAPQPVEFHSDTGETIAGAHQVVLSRDGSRFAFAGEGARIYAANPDGSGVRPISSGPTGGVISDGPRDSDPAISPDGSLVVFVRSNNSWYSALFLVNVDTGEERQLTDFTNDLDPSWSPDGSRILFTTSRDGFQELYTMAPDGSELQRLTQNELINDLQSSYSPDGSQIAYITNYSVGDGTAEIWIMDSDGSNQRRLTENDVDDQRPTWSPDGRYLAFSTGTRPPDIRVAVYVYDLKSEQLHQLTASDGWSYFPVWSPDSQWVAVLTSDTVSGPRYLSIIRRDGSDTHIVQPGNDYSAGDIWLWQP
jgi:Tol biopolymer transport system component